MKQNQKSEKFEKSTQSARTNADVSVAPKNPIRVLKAEGKWQTLSKEERQAVKQKFQQMKQNQKSEKLEKPTQPTPHNVSVSVIAKNPIRALKLEGKWQTLSKEERQALKKKCQSQKPKADLLLDLKPKEVELIQILRNMNF
eukprot:TRINITY_DN4162_c0_g1_i1.p1 TRINITY_DN4162_c0_g1~~TRINITY_DN4162_c0_g1_i1.p1  ORF type:complete len:142 (+),score=36.26 TRINITY_DN4162_c0_g1_i1:286-711(+)